ncbi:RHE_PE00001 family protein [Rhizobium oryziradicis]|uniref:Uncharacterized protein n=1 Tax=Rhizobium oryziradicis TaxID=1867956 RepID=A0A1Q8ZKY1_9HYPH|nr:RHE_PE00001 family protein [Rhizobium oryziradicis]OLP42400.1 hypothetical protein BJF95_13240 [Rhizobium oryziradicis]
MRYPIEKIPLSSLLLPISVAGEALVRLDERLTHSEVGSGLIERMHYSDAVGSLWVDGELVHVEDLVFHDARMDTRTPTHELTVAHLVLRSRRDITQHPAAWALSNQGLSRLRGRALGDGVAPVSDASEPVSELEMEGASPDPDAAFMAELDEFDAILRRSETLMAQVALERKAVLERDRAAIVYDADWNEPQRLQDWQELLSEVDAFPPVLAAAILLDAWQSEEVSEHSPWLGRLLAAAYLRKTGTTTCHLTAISVGLRAVGRERRHSKNRTQRLLAILEAFEQAARQGMNEHDRLLLARGALERRIKGRRSSSKLPELIDLVLSRPLVSAGLVAKTLNTTPQGALKLIAELPLRELTGRGRFRAWGIL